MGILDSVLREKHLRRIQRLQQLQLMHTRSDESAHTLATTRHAHQDANNLLWRLMSSADALCVQRLGLTRMQETATAKAMDDAAGVHESNRRQVEQLALGLARIDKDIEKLGERREEIAAIAASDRLKADWSQMDAWVLGMKDRGEGT